MHIEKLKNQPLYSSFSNKSLRWMFNWVINSWTLLQDCFGLSKNFKASTMDFFFRGEYWIKRITNPLLAAGY